MAARGERCSKRQCCWSGLGQVLGLGPGHSNTVAEGLCKAKGSRQRLWSLLHCCLHLLLHLPAAAISKMRCCCTAMLPCNCHSTSSRKQDFGFSSLRCCPALASAMTICDSDRLGVGSAALHCCSALAIAIATVICSLKHERCLLRLSALGAQLPGGPCTLRRAACLSLQLVGCSPACRANAVARLQYHLQRLNPDPQSNMPCLPTLQVKRKKILHLPVYPAASEPLPDSVWLQEDAAEPRAEDTAMRAGNEPVRHFDCAESRAVTFQRVHEKG